MLARFNQKAQGMLSYLLGVFFHTILIVMFKKVMREYSLPVYEIITLRQLIIVICLTPYMFKEKFDFFHKERMLPNVVKNILFAISTVFLYQGLAVVPVNDAVTIQFIIPIIASIMAVWLLKENPSKRLWIGLCMCIAGVVVAKQTTLSAVQKYGYILILLCVVIRSYIAILNKKVTAHSSVMQMLYYTHIIMLIFNMCFFTTFKTFPIEALYMIVLLAISFFGEFFFMYYGYKKCDVSSLQPLDFFKLIFSIIISGIILNESVTYNQLIGGAIVICAYLYSSRKK